MKRRRFLQLAAGAAAAAVARHSSALSFTEGRTSQPETADVLWLAAGEPPLASFAAIRAGFGASHGLALEPGQMIALLLEQTSDGGYQWTIDGRPHPAEALLLERGRRYRLRMMNATDGVHTVHLRHHRFAVARIHQVPVSGISTDTLRLERYNVVEADVLMTRPGPLLLRYPNT